jgi:hypothetical protein
MSDIMQAYRDFQARVSADPQQEAMRQTLLNSNSPFALLGRGVGNVANASLPPTADMLRAQIQSNPETNNPSMPESVDNTVETVGNTIKFFQDMQAPSWLDPYQTGQDIRQGVSSVADEVVGGAKQIGNVVLGGAEAVADPFVQVAQGFMGKEATGVEKGSFGRYGEGIVSVPPTPEDEDPYGLDGDEAVVSTPIVDKGMTTAEIDAEGGTGERKTNWFDAVESRVDLMAMGAAMLANSSSGKGTLANLGEALQVGLGAKKSVAKAKQDKEYKDKLMALELLKLQNVDNKFRNYTSKISNISAMLEGKGVPDDESKGIASIIFAETDGDFVDYDPNVQSSFLNDLIKGTTSWYDVGKPDVAKTKIRSVIADMSDPKKKAEGKS